MNKKKRLEMEGVLSSFISQPEPPLSVLPTEPAALPPSTLNTTIPEYSTTLEEENPISEEILEKEKESITEDKKTKTRKKYNKNPNASNKKRLVSDDMPLLAQLSVKVPENLLRDLRALAFWQREQLQDLIARLFAQHLDQIPLDILEKARKEYQK